MARAFIGIGSNIDPAENVRAAIISLARATRLTAISMVYRTDALDRPDQPPYFNCVAEIGTDLPPLEVKRNILRVIECSLGRERSADKYAPRKIDLDLIAYDDVVMDADGLTLPDPEIRKRPFLAIPLFELAPDLVLAGCNERIADIASRLPRGGLEPLKDYARTLRQQV